MGTFKAIRIDKAEKGTTVALTQFDEAELMEGDVTVAVEWSTLNYKDGLALTGKAPVVRRFPMIAGIDFAGTVAQSSNPAWKAAAKVACNGWGMAETHLGAYAEKARVKADCLGKGPGVRRFPMIAGIGFAGTVAQASNPAWKAGDKVVCNGWGMGETHLGAYAEKARVKGDWLVKLPDGVSTRDAMAIGTAGYTA